MATKQNFPECCGIEILAHFSGGGYTNGFYRSTTGVKHVGKCIEKSAADERIYGFTHQRIQNFIFVLNSEQQRIFKTDLELLDCKVIHTAKNHNENGATLYIWFYDGTRDVKEIKKRLAFLKGQFEKDKKNASAKDS